MVFLPALSERCLRGRKEQFAKLSYLETGTAGSNPALSASGVLAIKALTIFGV